jgi:tetratricopeptide (TPR) repeat protein
LNKLLILLVLLCPLAAMADKAYTKNKRANLLYNQKKYEEALKLYDEALLESPSDKKLAMNKGSAQYRLNQLDQAQESYESALTVTDPKAKQALLYNMGNTFVAQAQTNQQQAQEKLQKAKESYIKALDANPSDEDAKWNLEIVQNLLKQQQQNQQQNQNNNQNIEPSEYAKKMKALADEAVAQRQYQKALSIMEDLLKTDKTGMAYQNYIQRLKDVAQI